MTSHRGPDYWDERYRQKELMWTAQPNRFLVEVVEDWAPGRALDLAAGEGRNAVWLGALGWDVHAIDFSAVAITKARELAARSGVRSIDFVVEDLFEWSPPRLAYDLVMLIYFQVPAPERAAVWMKAAASVAPDGHLVVIGHDSDNLEHGYGGPPRPEALYTAAEVAETVGEVLEVQRSEQVIRPVEDDTGEHEAIDNVVVARRR